MMRRQTYRWALAIMVLVAHREVQSEFCEVWRFLSWFDERVSEDAAIEQQIAALVKESFGEAPHRIDRMAYGHRAG